MIPHICTSVCVCVFAQWWRWVLSTGKTCPLIYSEAANLSPLRVRERERCTQAQQNSSHSATQATSLVQQVDPPQRLFDLSSLLSCLCSLPPGSLPEGAVPDDWLRVNKATTTTRRQAAGWRGRSRVGVVHTLTFTLLALQLSTRWSAPVWACCYGYQ